jgi:asparagine synthase (glutamine-hydrolysing)
MDEPHGDASFIPTWLVSKTAREHVTFALSGDAGDEVFCGYDRHRLALLTDYLFPNRQWNQNSSKTSSEFSDLASKILLLLLNGVPGSYGALARRIAALQREHDPRQIYRVAAALVPTTTGIQTSADLELIKMQQSSFHSTVLLGDLMCYLPDNGLRKVDIASMANSLEVRIPFLDIDLVRLAFAEGRGTSTSLIRNKAALRALLPRYFSDLSPFYGKQGFSPPAHRWLLGPLAKWRETCVNNRLLLPDPALKATNALVTMNTHPRRRFEREWGACVLTHWCIINGFVK